jgi:hypothetical protein
MLAAFDRVFFLGVLGCVLMCLFMGMTSCALVTPPLRDGVYLESCLYDKAVDRDEVLTLEQKALRHQMTIANRRMVKAPLECGEVGR